MNGRLEKNKNLMKRCSKCGKFKPLDDFYRHKNGRQGRHAECKICLGVRSREHRGRNLEKSAEYSRRYRQKHRVKVGESSKKRQKKAREQLDEWYIKRYLRRHGYPEDFVNNPDMLELKRAEMLLKRKLRKQKKTSNEEK